MLDKEISTYFGIEIGGGICCTGAALAKKCKSVVSFELGNVHCLYAKRSKEYFNIDNLGVYCGSISDVKGHKKFDLKEKSVEIFISHMGMFREIIIPTLTEIARVLKKEGKFICVYPRFWTHSTNLNSVYKKLLKRSQINDARWFDFNKQLEKQLEKVNMKIDYSGLLKEYQSVSIGGDVIIGSKISLTKEEYFKNPISGIKFGQSQITCNTLVCHLIL